MKLNNLSRLTALLLALTMILSSVAWADPVAEGDYTADNYAEQLAAQTGTCEICVMETEFPTTDHNGNTISITCGYEYLENLGSPMERYLFLNYHYEQVNSGALSALYSVHTQHVEAGAENLWCNCAEYWSDFKEPGAENHLETCPWVDGTIVIIPDIPQPPVYGGDPQGKQYTSNEEYNLPMANDRAIILPEGGRAVIHSNQADGYQWQVYDGTQWVSIQGETGADLVVTTAKLNTIFDLTGVAELRYFDVANDIVKASVSVTSQEIAGGEYVDPVEEAQTLSLIERAEGDEEVFNYTIQFIMDTGEEVTKPWTAEWTAGDDPIDQMVTFPTVMGYEAYFDNAQTSSTSYQVKFDSLEADVIKTVMYHPALVNYTVIHYVQNANNDEYTEFERQEKQGYTRATVKAQPGAEMVRGADGVNQYVVHDTDYQGFYALLFEKPAIAADGSTVVEIYYDRIYYLMKFVLGEGGYGVEPIYGRYGETLDIGTPVRPGYTFCGWTENANNTDYDNLVDPNAVVTSITTMPAADKTYYAVWELADTVTVTIVHWGENADDENYSYMDSETIQVAPNTENYGYNGLTLKCTTAEHQHSDELLCYGCGSVEHKHTSACYSLTCTIPEHAAHTAECYGNCEYADHVHTVSCYRVNHGTLSTTPENDTERINSLNSTTPSNGVYRIGGSNRRFYIKVGDYYYRITGNDLNDYYGNGELTVSTTCAASNHTHNDDCLSCTLAIHTHSGREAENGCYERICGLNEHDHTDDCVVCTTTEHSHTAACFEGNIPSLTDRDPDTGNLLWTFVKTDIEPVVNPDGSTVINVYWDRTEFTLKFYTSSSSQTAIYTISDKWGADITKHWPIKGTNGTTYNNGERWDPYDNGKTSSKIYKEVLAYIDIMPAESFDLVLNTHSIGDGYVEYTMNYWIESLSKTDYETSWTEEGGETKYFNKKHTVEVIYNYVTDAEDFFDLEGFDQWDSDPEFSNGQIDRDNNPVVNFYYKRHKYTLEFYNPIARIEDKTVTGIPYQAPLAEHYFEPDASLAPDKYEPGSVYFEGWYLNPECTGEKFDFNTATMPAGVNDGDTTLTLYANWAPVQYRVTFHLTEEDAKNDIIFSKVNQVFTPEHDEYLFQHMTTEQQLQVRNEGMIGENGEYTFVGWFYIDEETGEEKAFVPADMMVKRDMKLYAKWSSNILVAYEVKYVYTDENGNKIEVAESTTGSALVETTRTFPAKGGLELKEAYQDGYFPVVKSHSIKMEEDATKNVYTFEYVKKDAVPYVVYYVTDTQPTDEDLANLGTVEINGKTYYKVAATKLNTDNAKAVVTEKFSLVPGYMPDAYQKNLVVTGEKVTDNNKITVDGVDLHEDNVIVFYYSINDEQAYYIITHYVETVTPGVWQEYYTYELVGEIGQIYSEEALSINGYTFDANITAEIVGDSLTVDSNKVSGTLTNQGLELELYYTRNEYPYQVRYLKRGTGEQLADPKNGTGKYGLQVSESAIDIDGYELDSESPQAITIKIETTNEAKVNIITFYYKERQVKLNYEVVGPENVSVADVGAVEINDDDEETLPAAAVSEQVDLFTGKPSGATAEPASNLYRFVGWYDNEACTGTSLSTDPSFIPEQPEDGKWVDGTTYYAKFVVDKAVLTIKKTGMTDGEVAVFNVSGPGYNGKVIVPNGTTGLTLYVTCGEYTITEVDAWSWRYTLKEVKVDGTSYTIMPEEITLDADGTTIEVVNNRTNDQWLSDESSIVNFDGTNQ